MSSKLWLLACVGLIFSTSAAAQQSMRQAYSSVLSSLGKQGDFKDGVLKVNIPRNDLKVVVDGVSTPTPFGFGGWIALTRGTGMDVMMGDLVLTEEELNPVMSAVLDAGLDVTAVHNHFFFETPRMFYMHVHGHGEAADLAGRIKPALALLGRNRLRDISRVPGRSIDGTLDVAQLAMVIGIEGEQNG